MWFRVDNRLVHGQIIEAWLPWTRARHLVVANDALADDSLRQQLVSLAVPGSITLHCVPVRDLAHRLDSCGDACFVLFANCRDARRAWDAGVAMKVLNMCNLHYAPHKQQILPQVALSSEDREDLFVLRQNCVRLDFRCVPTESPREKHACLP